MRTLALCATLAASLITSTAAHATNIDWTLTGLTFGGDNIEVSGTFVTDSSGTTLSYDLTFTGALSEEWTLSNSSFNGVGSSSFDITRGANEVNIVFGSDLDGLTSPNSVTNGYVCLGNCTVGDGFNYFDSNGSATGVPEATPAPEPASLALLGGGLMALAGVRRRRAG